MTNDDRMLIDRVNRLLNNELLKRLLIKYFTEKKCQDFTAPVYPPILQDLTMRVPELNNRIEIIPYIRESNLISGQVIIGWNLFVLGTQRMDLGESTHNNMADLQRAVHGPSHDNSHTSSKSPEEIIEFIIRVLSVSKSGNIQPAQGPAPFSPKSVVNRPSMGPTLSGSYYEKSKPY